MKYYLVKHIKKLANEFGGRAQGPLIKIKPKYKDAAGLIEHEKTHVQQWYALLAIGLMLCTALTLFVLASL